LQQRVGRYGLLANEVVIKLAHEETGRSGLFEDDPYHVASIPCTGLPEDGLRPTIVEPRIEFEPVAVAAPAGESAGRFADVLLGVVADTEAKQLHQLAGVVLVRLALHVAIRIEPEEHGPVSANGLQERTKPAQGVFAKQAVLAKHQLGALDLGDAGGEV